MLQRCKRLSSKTFLFCTLMFPAFAISEAQQDTVEAHRQFVEHWTAQTARRAQWLASKGLTENYQQIRAMLTLDLLKELFPTLPRPDGKLHFFEKIRLDQLAQELAVRYTPKTIRNLQQRGLDPIRNALIGAPTPAQFYEMSDDVIIGEVVAAKTPANLGDGYLTTVTIHVKDVLKGSLQKGDTIYLRQINGQVNDTLWKSQPDEVVRAVYGGLYVPPPHVPLLLHLSKKLYGLQVVTTDNTPDLSRAFYIQRLAPFRVEGSQLRYLGHSSAAEAKLPNSISEIRDVAVKYKD
jgi:hypothetical protein